MKRAFILSLMLLVVEKANATSVDSGVKAQAKNDVFQIYTAVQAYETEYGRLPGRGAGMVGGRILAALMGKNTALNPKGIVFLEVKPAKRGKGGILNGVFMDPWGGPYQIVYGPNSGGKVIAGVPGTEIGKKVGVWNDPNLGEDAATASAAKKKRRYVTSWD